MKVAVIPARGGSKRIPRKNIRTFCGKPMIAWSIEAAQLSGVFDHVIVSTDDAEIAAVAEKGGAEVPFVRPANISDDHADTLSVMVHAVEWAEEKAWSLEAVCCIYATAPFLQAADIRSGLNTLINGHWNYVFSATEYAAPIFRSFRQLDSSGVEMFFPENFSKRSQDLPKAMHDAGQFYWGRPFAWRERRQIFTPNSTVVNLPRWRVADIDTEEDWQRAELIAPTILHHVNHS